MRETNAPASPPSAARRVFGHPLTHLVMAVLLLAVVQMFFVKIFAVPSESMQQTLDIGDRILVNRLATEPTNGDVIVFTTDDELWHTEPEP
ncbi:MAG: signal peptidase I, partial [Leucobacter sp.]